MSQSPSVSSRRYLLLTMAAVFCATTLADSAALAKSTYLNGVDISSARSQNLKKVDVLINEHGDIFILAPHYQVNEEDSYVPLSRYIQGLNQPTHKAPGKINGETLKNAQSVKYENGQIAKAGEPLPEDSSQLPVATEAKATDGVEPTGASSSVLQEKTGSDKNE